MQTFSNILRHVHHYNEPTLFFSFTFSLLGTLPITFFEDRGYRKSFSDNTVHNILNGLFIVENGKK